MKKKFVRAVECEIGEMIAEDVMNSYGGVLVTENTTVTHTVKEKLLENNIDRVRVYVPEPAFKKEDPGFAAAREAYGGSVDMMKDVFQNLITGKPLEMDKINAISDYIYEQAHSESHIVQCIHSLKNTDEYTYTHSINVSLYAMMIAKWLKLSKAKIKEVIQAGLLHDIGKMNVPLEILNKPGKLDPDEFAVIKRHSTFGYEIISKLEGVSDAIKLGVLMHHERENGSGYPLGIRNSSIHLYSKIIAIVDVYDAITSARVYKPKQTPFSAFKEFKHQMFGFFDSSMLSVFLDNIVHCYVGTNVLLSNSDVGEVIYINPMDISSPIVRINSELFDLSNEKELKILGLI